MSIIDLQTEQESMEVQLLKARMLQVEEQLIKKTPELPTILHDIHKNMQEHEELVHLLDDEDIGKIHRAFELHKQQALLQKEMDKAKGKGTGSRKNKKLTDADLENL